MKMKPFGKFHRFHLIGICGNGMSGLAEILLALGCEVSGSDLQPESPVLDRLRVLGARIHSDHRSSNIGKAQAVVFSSAIPHDNPELETASTQRLPLIPRAQMLAELMRFKLGITVSGSHGKTTTAAMVASLLLDAGLDPTLVIGARLKSLETNAHLGNGPFVVAEADESDRSFLRLSPIYAIVTNIDHEHLDEYQDLEDLKQAFLCHLNRVPFYGTVIGCRDDPNLQPLLKNVHRPMITYGLESAAEVTARNLQLDMLGSVYECYHRDRYLGNVELAVPGRHNVLNSLAAVAMGLLLEIPFVSIHRALKAFTGVERRWEWKGEKEGVLVIDDYAHHPTEIRVTLDTCKARGRRLVVVFQPHRYSRTMHLMKEMGTCFEDADLLYLLDIYPAGEQPIPGIDSQQLAQQIGHHRPVTYVPDRRKLLKSLKKITSPGDLLLTLGAGDVWRIGESFLE